MTVCLNSQAQINYMHQFIKLDQDKLRAKWNQLLSALWQMVADQELINRIKLQLSCLDLLGKSETVMAI